MNDWEKKIGRRRSALSAGSVALIAFAGGLVTVACFGDNGSNGGSADDAGGGTSGRGGSSGTTGDGGSEGGEAGDGMTGGSGGKGGKGGKGGMSGMSGMGGMSGMSGTGGSGGMPGSDCGNGTMDQGEECDDGNTLDGDDCSWNCTLGCAECHQNECPMVGADVAMFINDCFEDETPAAAGPAQGIPRGELCRALVSCVHRTQCGTGGPDGTVAIEECYCFADFFSCTSPTTFVPGQCKAEYEEAAETTDATEALTSASDVSRASGRAWAVLNYCDNEFGPCHDQCFGDGNGGTGGIGGMGGMSGAGMGGAGMGGGGAGGAGAGTGGAGMSGSGGVSPSCGDGTTSGTEECDGGGTSTYIGTESCSNDCRRIASEECLTCEHGKAASTYCGPLTTGCRDWPTAAGRAACYDLAECIYDNPSCTTPAVEGCYCGAATTMACGAKPAYPDPNAPNGPCARQFEAAMQTTTPATVLVNFNTTSVPGNAVVQRVQCDLMFCPTECF